MKTNSNIHELEDIIKGNLIAVNNLKNTIEQKELEKQDLLKEIASSIIDIIDSFERLEEGYASQDQEQKETFFKIKKRYQIIQTKLINLLQKYGIKKIEFPENRLIVGLCEVVGTQNDVSRKNDEIISIVRNGYIRGKELIKAAQVIIVKN